MHQTRCLKGTRDYWPGLTPAAFAPLPSLTTMLSSVIAWIQANTEKVVQFDLYSQTKEVRHVNMCHTAMQAVSGFIYLFIFDESVVYNDALLGKVTKMTYV